MDQIIDELTDALNDASHDESTDLIDESNKKQMKILKETMIEMLEDISEKDEILDEIKKNYEKMKLWKEYVEDSEKMKELERNVKLLNNTFGEEIMEIKKEYGIIWVKRWDMLYRM
jgi:hypothetical protein